MQVACYGFEAISQFFHRKEPDAQKRIPPVACDRGGSAAYDHCSAVFSFLM